jgi:hypothetical protein
VHGRVSRLPGLLWSLPRGWAAGWLLPCASSPPAARFNPLLVTCYAVAGISLAANLRLPCLFVTQLIYLTRLLAYEVLLQSQSASIHFRLQTPCAALPHTNCRPTCQMFIVDSLCCEEYGIVLHASVKMWLVCNADVYLPEPKCLTGAWLVLCAVRCLRLGAAAWLAACASLLRWRPILKAGHEAGSAPTRLGPAILSSPHLPS